MGTARRMRADADTPWPEHEEQSAGEPVQAEQESAPAAVRAGPDGEEARAAAQQPAGHECDAPPAIARQAARPDQAPDALRTQAGAGPDSQEAAMLLQEPLQRMRTDPLEESA